MKDRTNKIIDYIRVQLSKEPMAIIIGEIREPNELLDKKLVAKMQSYYDFLLQSDGARMGGIDLWSYDDVLSNQYKVINLEGVEEKWINIGQILYEPLVLNKIDGKIYRYYQGCEDEIEPDCLEDIDYFLQYYVFGRGYEEIIPEVEDDDWYQFIKKEHFFDNII